MDGSYRSTLLTCQRNCVPAADEQRTSWTRSVLFVEETGVPGENHRPATSHCDYSIIKNLKMCLKKD